MSYLGNAWEFEKFNLKDMWGKIKDDPERLFIGAVTPWTSKMWGKILGKDYEPIVDQMGGPYGGSTISAFGNKDGGVYARAKESGVPTKEAGNLHDAAHVIAALYAGGYGLGALGGGGAAGGAAAPSAAGSTASSAAPSVAGFMPGTAAAPMEGITVYGSSGLGMGAGTEAAMAAAGAGGATAAGNQGFDWQRMLNQSMPTGGNQQQQMQSAAPARGARPGMWDRIKGGLGKMGDNLLQIDSRAAESMSPDQLAALKRNAFLNMGLGMMAASNRGAGFGEAAAFGLGQGQAGLTNALQRDYEMAREARREQRQQTRDEIEDRRYEEERAYRAEQDRIRQEMEREQMEESRRRFEENIALDRAGLGLRERQLAMTAGLGRIPAGYRMRADGTGYEPIPGGPADMSGAAGRKASQQLRKEFRGLQSVKDYETALPLIQSAATAPDNGYGDLQLIYSVGKILDPGSVVREGELALTMAAGSPLQRIIGSTRFTTEQGGRLTPQQREQIMGMLQERVGAYKQAYERDFNQYAEYAQEAGFDPTMVVGSHAESAYAQPPQATKEIGGKTYVMIDGQWYEAD